jgi:RNA polymerase sigma-70 factor (ECF subfamily)
VPADDDRDFDVMIRLSQKDEGALQELFDRHGGAVFGLARRIVNDTQLAEEVLQDTFLRVTRDAASYRTSSTGALPWLLRIARNAAIDIVRRRRRDKGAADPKVLDLVADTRTNEALEGVVLGEFAVAVRNALAELPDGPRKALDLAYFAGLTQTEIAERLKVPLGTAKTWVRNGLQSLRERLGNVLGTGRVT